MEKKLLIKYATRTRPNRMLSIINSILSNSIIPNNISICISLDSDDKIVLEKSTLDKLQTILKASKVNIRVFVSPRSTKVEAINRDVEKMGDWDYVLPITDYTEINTKGFDTLILDNVKENEVTFLSSINDNGIEKHFIPVIPKKLYDKNGFIYNPQLKANFLTEELERRFEGSINITETLCIHRYIHPEWLYFDSDTLLLENLKNWKEDLETIEAL